MTYNLYINDTIGWPISAAYVRQELAKVKGKPCNVYISSLGGDVATALQIRQFFLEHGEVTAHLHGFVASAATIIATGAKEVRMGEFALFMIHKCSTWQEQWGQMNSDDIAAAIDKLTSAKNALDSIDHVIGSIYAQRTGKPVSTIAEMMKDETWLSAEKAKEQGFVDDIIPDEQPAALTDDLRRRILACGYPLPEAIKGNETFWQRFRREIVAIFTPTAHLSNSINNPKTPTTTMNKEYKAILAVLLLEALATTDDGKFTLSDKQMQALNDRLASLAAEKQIAEDSLAAARQQITTLTAQVEALKQADGDDTTHVEGNGEEVENHTANARADYEKLKTLIA